jgi:hexosaminidase
VQGAGVASLTAVTVYGALRGLETFSQLVTHDMYYGTYSLQAVMVVDAPRFQYRGL